MLTYGNVRLEGLQKTDATLVEKLKYVCSQIKTHWRNPHWWKGRFMVYVGGNIVNGYWYRKYPHNRIVSVMKEDWDNLIILDACRWDTFVEAYGECDYRISRGSSTIEFLRKNFLNKRFLDTVYVTANPFVNRFTPSFYRVISVWKDGWDDDSGTVYPEIMFKYALEAESKYPDKRLIIHFIQPHYPYIGDPEVNRVVYRKDWFRDMASGKDIPDVITNLLRSEAGNMRIKDAYRKTLELALPYALKLAKNLRGKTVITADHGEAFGEFAFPLPMRVYGHPSNVHIPVLVKVPWLVIDKGERKEIRSENEKEKLRRLVRKLKRSGKL